MAGALLIVLVTSVAYLPSIRGEFLLDDTLNLTENDLVRATDGPYKFWLTTEPIDYWPLFNTSLWLEWRLWGTNPLGYHVTNLALHIATVLLVWTTLVKLSVPGAFLAAMLFAVHPVNVESVAWITQLKNLLALFFSLVSVLCYLEEEQRWRQRARGARAVGLWYAASLGSFTLAMLSKGSVAVVPLLLLGVLRWLRPLTWKDIVRLGPFFLVCAVLVPVNIWFQSRLGTQLPAAGLVESVLRAASIVWFYLLKALVPLDLTFIYPLWKVNAGRLAWWLPLLAAAAVTAIFWRYRDSWARAPLFAWAYFCISLVPVMAFTPVGFMEHSLVADHYQHLALIGVVGIVASGWAIWRGRARGPARWTANGVALATTAALALLTWQQCHLYVDGVKLFRDTLKKNPTSWMAHNNLAALLTDAGREQEAIEHLQQALRLKADYPDAHNNLGRALHDSGRLQEAIEHYERAIELKPGFPTAHYNLGLALAQAGDLEEAIAHYRQALRLQPTYTQAHLNLGNALADAGRLEEAIKQYEETLRLDPNFVGAHYNLGVALAQAGRTREAIEQYRNALRLQPDSSRAHYDLGIALIQDRPGEAIAHLREALRLDPDYAAAHNDLGVALVGASRLSEAVGHFEQALRLQPDFPDARYNLEVARGLQRSGGAGASAQRTTAPVP